MPPGQGGSAHMYFHFLPGRFSSRDTGADQTTNQPTNQPTNTEDYVQTTGDNECGSMLRSSVPLCTTQNLIDA